MQYYPFDSRNILYRDKIGALAEGETLRLRLLLHNDAKVHSAYLVLREDSCDAWQEILLQPTSWIEDYRYYECDVALKEGLYWYSFRYTSDYGEFKVTKTETSLGIVTNDGGCWQQTVYTEFNTPHWLEGGIIYQIFPDRFYRSGVKKDNIPSDRYLCEDWDKTPEYRQDNTFQCLGNDYYGGDLKGIEEKLDYIADLGVNCIYLNPIFEAHSNHRYNTADYMKIDALLGNEKDLCSLINKARKKGINIILDGVFSHTGDDSIYFNSKSRYSETGALQSKNSPYYSWYNFTDYPDKYESWWGIKTLPETNENDPSFSVFITGENGVLRYWLKKGIKGWRLDVADELPDEFLDKVRTAIKSHSEDNYLLGEVWEDASNKISYSKRRRFLRGKQLDSVMNYPFANAIVDFVKNGNSENLMNTVLNITENYPKNSVNVLMNHIGTHDTARILTRLGTNYGFDKPRDEQANIHLNEQELQNAVKLLKLAAVLQYTLPGVPSLYYGDEAGLQGYSDPFCRAAFPWGKENTEILEFYKNLGFLRRNNQVFANGEFLPFKMVHGLICYLRKTKNLELLIAVNVNDFACDFEISTSYETIFGGDISDNKIILKPYSYLIAKRK